MAEAQGANGSEARSSARRTWHLLEMPTPLHAAGWLGRTWGAHPGSLVKRHACEVESYGLSLAECGLRRPCSLDGCHHDVHMPWGDKTRDTTPPNVVIRLQGYYNIF